MSYDELSRFLSASVSPDNIIFAADDELTCDGPLTDDDLDIWKGLPEHDRTSAHKSPAVAMHRLKIYISRITMAIQLIFSQNYSKIL